MHQHAKNNSVSSALPPGYGDEDNLITDGKSSSLCKALEGLTLFCPPLAQYVKAILDRVADLEMLFLRQFDNARLLTRDQTAALLACSATQVDRWIANRQLQVTYLDRRPRVPLAEAVRFWKSRVKK